VNVSVFPQNNENLTSFFNFLFEGLEGYAYVLSIHPTDKDDAKQYFFQYPEQQAQLEETVIHLSPEREVYVSPALYTSSNSAERENVKATNVVWAEFDGNAPQPEVYDQTPSLKIQSSSSGHQHVYWRLSAPLYDTDAIETINRNLTYALGADASGWEANQVLRPPGTRNHKRSLPTSVVESTSFRYDVHVFDNLAPAPALINVDEWEPSVIPDVTDVILKYPFDAQQSRLFKATVPQVLKMFPQEGRSGALMQLAYFGCEMGMSDPEIYSLLCNADMRWDKFHKRKDQPKRLATIISTARVKHPYSETGVEDTPFYALNYVDFLETDIEIDWVIPGMLMEQGYMLFTGPSGLGKTQMMLKFAEAIALGKNFLGYEIERPRKIVVLSLEMGHPDLKHFVSQQAAALQPGDLEVLRENYIVIPYGEPWPLDTPLGQQRLKQVLEELQPEGLFIDSVGSALSGSISQEEPVKKAMGFNDHLLRKYNIFTWWIHHMRKAQGDNKRPETQDDVYGNQYLFNRASSVYGLFGKPDGSDLRIKNLKKRLAPVEETYGIERLPNLSFQRTGTKVASEHIVKALTYVKPEHEKGPTSDGTVSGGIDPYNGGKSTL
jgi:hypothetical protein